MKLSRRDKETIDKSIDRYLAFKEYCLSKHNLSEEELLIIGRLLTN